jgi:rod shape-determining protein MreC
MFFSSANRFLGNIEQTRSDFRDRLDYKQRYDSLLQTHTNLLNKQPGSFFQNQIIVDSLLRDSSYLQLYELYPADVIKNDFTQKNNLITLNKGRKHGLRPHMGVIEDDGLVGVVVAVSKHYARAISLLHYRLRITVEVKGKDLPGALVWKGNHPNYLYMEGVPAHYDLSVGDTIQTSQLSRLFPPDLIVGTISELRVPPGSSSYEIQVKLQNDLRKTRQVYVVDNKHLEEIEELEAQTADE